MAKNQSYKKLTSNKDIYRIGENLMGPSVSKNLNLPIIATQEVFYLTQDMHEAHDAYLCIGEKTYVNSKDRKKIRFEMLNEV